MKEATDVLAATARLFNAVAETLEKAANPLVARETSAVAPAPVPPAAEPKKRKKAEPAAAVPAAPSAPAADVDPLMQAEAPAAVPPPAPDATASRMGYNEAESAAKAAELAKALCNAFPEKEANNRPKGFNLAMGILSKFKVARTSDLIHSQRLEFIAQAEPLLPRAVAA